MEREQIIKALECCLKAETLGDCEAIKCPALRKNGCYFYFRTAEDHDHALCNEQIKTAIGIIKELTEENERLRTENAEQDEAILNALKQMGEIRKEADTKNKLVIEQCDKAMESQLQMYKNNLKYFEEDYKKKIDMYMEATGLNQIKADTVRKMQEEINKTLSALCKGDVSDICRMIDQIAKEMIKIG